MLTKIIFVFAIALVLCQIIDGRGLESRRKRDLLDSIQKGFGDFSKIIKDGVSDAVQGVGDFAQSVGTKSKDLVNKISSN